MKMTKQFGWMIGLGILSFTLVGVGTTSTPRGAQASADAAPICQPAVAPEPPPARTVAAVVPQGVPTGGMAGGPPLDQGSVRAFPLAVATPKAPTSTALIFMPLGARQ